MSHTVGSRVFHKDGRAGTVTRVGQTTLGIIWDNGAWNSCPLEDFIDTFDTLNQHQGNLIENLRWLFQRDKKMKKYVKNVPGGVDLMFYYCDLLKDLPKGIEVTVSNTTKARYGDLMVLGWIFNVALKKAMEMEKMRVNSTRHSKRTRNTSY